MTNIEELKSKLYALALPIFDSVRLDLVELNIRRQGGDWMVQVFADRPQGGISLEECAYLNHKLVEVFDAHAAIVDYSLEVSSPGIDRPLKTKKDFQRALNQIVRLHLSELLNGKKEYIGQILAVEEAEVIVETQKNGKLEVPIKNIVKAVQVFD